MVTYKSRVDPIVGIALGWVVLAIPLSIVGAVAAYGSSAAGALIILGVGVVVAALVPLVAWPVQYTLAADELIIRFGVIRQRVPYAAIEEVTPSRSLVGAPALSLDRLRIRHRRGAVLVSPKDRAGFLRDLAARDPALVLEGEALRRRGSERA